LRQKIGVVFGNPETTTGGNALKFYASVRFDVRRIGKVTLGENVVGNRTRVKVVAPLLSLRPNSTSAGGLASTPGLTWSEPPPRLACGSPRTF